MLRWLTAAIVAFVCSAQGVIAGETWPGFRRSPWFEECRREAWLEGSVRALMIAPPRFEADRPTQLIIFATPNGNTIEQTLGSACAAETDWRFDIQHIAAQVRLWRSLQPDVNVVLACIEAEGLSWPGWRRTQTDAAAKTRRIVDALRSWVPAPCTVVLAGHSGGGSFLFGFLDAGDTVPDAIDRFLFLDANYSYDDNLKHGDKLLAWLRRDERRHLIVIAYDDRDVTLNGKKVVSPTGGTFRATERMRTRFLQDVEFLPSTTGPFQTAKALEGHITIHVHPNPDNKILHTALVGEMNGLLEGLGVGRTVMWGTFGGPRAYVDFVQPAAEIPPRPADAEGGAAFMRRVAHLSRMERETAIAEEFIRGNLPDFLRRWQPIEVKAVDDAGCEHVARFEVLPDYLSVGSDADFVRVPMTPQTAEQIAERFGAALPTKKMVDDIARHATVCLTPQPLTQDREAVATFLQHHLLIEEQFGDRPRGGLVAGIKKDVVVSNRLDERPNRLALYGWHQRDGSPIQPLTTVHVDWYVDYSHGVRLVKRTVTVDHQPRDIRHVLRDSQLYRLLSDEGPVLRGTY